MISLVNKINNHIGIAKFFKRTLVKEVNDKVWFSIHDINGVYLNCSQNVEKILGIKSEYFIGKSVYEFVHPDDTRQLSKSHLVYLEEDIKIGVEEVLYRMRDSKNKWIWIKATSTEIDTKLVVMRTLF